LLISLTYDLLYNRLWKRVLLFTVLFMCRRFAGSQRHSPESLMHSLTCPSLHCRYLIYIFY